MERRRKRREEGGESKSLGGGGQRLRRGGRISMSLHLLGWRLPELLSVHTLQAPNGEMLGGG